MSTAQPERSLLTRPPNPELPLFVYGALKPGMPAFERLQPFVMEPIQRDQVGGSLYVRDGLPLLFLSDYETLVGYLLEWKPSEASNGYDVVCQFEPRKHYQWSEVTLLSGIKANTLTVRFPNKGNPQPLHQRAWRITDDPAFGPGLAAVREACNQLPSENHSEDDWSGFFRAQMAYLLLWSILERLSALCCGPDKDPHQRVLMLAELSGMKELLVRHVHRADKVSDSRNPENTLKLDSSNPRKCFEYYYQVRSNLSHRGKGVWKEYDKVKNSLMELLAITEDYLNQLGSSEAEYQKGN